MTRPTHVLLDLDGTLTDSRPGIIAGYQAALRALGHEPDPSLDLTPFIGPPMIDVATELLRRYGDTRAEEAAAAYRDYYGTTGLFEATLYDGMPACLDALRGAGLHLYVATSKRVEFARPILEHFGLADRFAGIYGAVSGGALDHKPELLGHVLAEQGIAPGDAVMVGDRRYDISAAHAHGMRGIGVLWGYGTREELEQAGANRTVATPAELTDALLQP
jgi:phosphoglycolate phosphatase